METARWNGHIFEVSPSLVRSFSGLTVKGSTETDDKMSGKQKYAIRKNANPIEIGMTVLLSALTGCSVREEAMGLVSDAGSGEADYLYIGGEKLVQCTLMLTEASVSKTEIAPGGQWVSCSVKLTFKQAGKSGAERTQTNAGASSGSSGSSGGWGKQTVRKKASTTMTTVYNSDVQSNVRNKVASAVQAVKKAKSASTSTGTSARQLLSKIFHR
ncbi:MAG: hypothetical protein ACI4PG_03805 [Candidatus Ventricola sp.]